MPTLGTWMIENFLQLATLLGAAVAFGVGMLQYRRAQQWKRAEWVAQEIGELFGDHRVRAALLMIDWGSRRIMLHPDRTAEADRFVFVDDDEVARALMPHDERPNGFSDWEADIRGAFDSLLDGLERLQAYVDAGLVTVADVSPYWKYWADRICAVPATDGSQDRLRRLQAYIDKYSFNGAARLLQSVAASPQRGAAKMLRGPAGV